MQTILTVDDERSVRDSYRMILGSDHRVIPAENGLQALDVLDANHVDLIVLDLMMPGMSGMEFLLELESRGETIPVVVVTASNSVESAVECMKHGAHEFVVKPFDIEELTKVVGRILDRERERRELITLREARAGGFQHIVGEAPTLLDALAKAQQAMHVDSTVLITGETGTGKDVLARAIHAGGPRAKAAFVALSCCAIPESLIEGELFGHVKGAFTGAIEKRVGKMQVADGGTLFLDEIGEMPIEAQAKLLRVLQEGSFYPVGGTREVHADVRFVCATNRRFDEAITEGRFRQDLYYRINVLPIEMPPLRQRREDIPLLVAHFMAKHGFRVNSHAREFAPRAMARLAAYDWPGNVRELENTVERLLVCHQHERMIQPDHVESVLPRQRGADPVQWDDFDGLPLEEATARLERHLIERALTRCNNVQSQAADALGTTRRILKYKMDQLGIDPGSAANALAG